jgi:crotonobetainyl-CoA:carnitine CoA-transferase CaiB-like acyl-CoA transferase
MDARPGPLAGVRVLDLSRVLSGPFCGRALADLGAEVVKVEPPEGDLTRFSHPRTGSMSLYYAQQNAGKRNVSLDLRRPEAVELVLRLAERSDILLENFRPGVMARMGLGYDDVAARNPGIVYGSITGYGQDGPWSDRRAYAVVIHAETGMVATTAEHRGGEARNEPFSHADVYAGLECLAGVLAALYQRQSTGRGQHVDVAMASALLAVNERVQADLSDIDIGDELSSLSPGASPVLAGPGGARFTVAGDPCASHTFPSFVRLLGREELAADPRYADVAARRANRDALVAEVQRWVDGFDTMAEVEEAFGQARLPVGVVRTVAEVAASDWAAHRGAIAEVSDRGQGTIRIPDAPWRFSDAHAGVAGDPAFRGEHNREVLAELGLADEEIDRLEATGVLSSRIPAGTRTRQAPPRGALAT